MRILYLLLAASVVGEIIYHLVKYPGQGGSFLGFDLSEPIYLLVHAALALLLFYGYYKYKRKEAA